jgi:hypothetical protein
MDMNINFANLMDTTNFIHNNKIVILNEYILDPLSVIIKLAIISNKAVGTKLYIYKNVVHIQEPSIFQSIYRYSVNTNKSDLQYLYNPIENACKLYLNEANIREYPNIVKLFECAQNGLLKLSETYKNCSMMRLCLNYYNGIIMNYFEKINNNVFLENLFKKDNISPLYTDDFLNQFVSIWTPDKINVILNLTSFLLKDKDPHDNVKTMETIIDGIDRKVQQINF